MSARCTVLAPAAESEAGAGDHPAARSPCLTARVTSPLNHGTHLALPREAKTNLFLMINVTVRGKLKQLPGSAEGPRWREAEAGWTRARSPDPVACQPEPQGLGSLTLSSALQVGGQPRASSGQEAPGAGEDLGSDRSSGSDLPIAV